MISKGSKGVVISGKPLLGELVRFLSEALILRLMLAARVPAFGHRRLWAMEVHLIAIKVGIVSVAIDLGCVVTGASDVKSPTLLKRYTSFGCHELDKDPCSGKHGNEQTPKLDV